MVIHTPYQAMPPLSDEEYAALKDDIRVNGQIVPILIDEHNNILDGHNRYQICTELGIEPIVEVKEGLSEAEKWGTALRLNANRRQLSNEQKRTLVQNELRRDPSRTDAAIARAIGVSASMVGSHRREMQAEAEKDSWSPEYREAIEHIVELTRQEVEGWARLADIVEQFARDDPDNFDTYMERIGLDEETAAQLFHHVETYSWNKWPSLVRTFQKLVPFRERLTHGVTYTEEHGFVFPGHPELNSNWSWPPAEEETA